MTKTRVTYESERIEFSDIKAGDMIEIKWKEDGVIDLSRGICFESKEYIHGHTGWFTMEGGLVVADHADAPIYRITPISAERV